MEKPAKKATRKKAASSKTRSTAKTSAPEVKKRSAKKATKKKGKKKMSDQQILHKAYEDIKALCALSHTAPDTRNGIKRLCELSIDFMHSKAELIPLISKVAGKQYVTYRNSTSVARPANKALFEPDPTTFRQLWAKWEDKTASSAERLRLLYTAALAPCLAMELFDKQNKKGPATYFECFIGNLVATKLKKEPYRQASLGIGEAAVRLTMDFLFAVDGNKKGIHLPVKMSTRERVVQAWAHQRLLDSAYGVGTYSGLMILFSETKLDSKKLAIR